MPISDMIPWKRQEASPQEEGQALATEEDSFLSFQQEMNQLFDRFFSASDLEPFGVFRRGWGAFYPLVDADETDKEIRLSIELPGLDEDDIDLSLARGVLTIQGAKEQEQDRESRRSFRSERAYGSFSRSITLPCEVDPDHVNARLQKGVLTVTLRKAPETKARRTVPIRTI